MSYIRGHANICISQIGRFHSVKSVRIRIFSGQYFPVFVLNMKRYSVSLRILSKYGKIRARRTPHTDAIHVVFALFIVVLRKSRDLSLKSLVTIKL